MLTANFSIYQGQGKRGVFVKAYTLNNFFLVVKINASQEIDKLSDEEKRWDQAISAFLHGYHQGQINNLNSLESFLYEAFKKHNLPSGTSLALAYLKDNILYLKTMDEGLVFLKKGKNLAKLIEGDNAASGYIEEKDFFIFTFSPFWSLIENENELKKSIEHVEKKENNAQKLKEYFDLKFKDKDTFNQIALFLTFEKTVMPQQFELLARPKELPSKAETLQTKESTITQKSNSWEKLKSKKITVIAVALIFIILIWSVGLGYSRRQETQKKEKISKTKESIEKKLASASEIAFLNLSNAQSLLSESRDELVKLKKEVKNIKKEEIQALEELIQTKENEILKKEDIKPEEFYDLALEDKEASGEKMYLEENTTAILDKKGKVYLLSLTKKSIEKKTFDEIKKASDIAFYEDKLFLYIPNEGIYQIKDNTISKVIENDSEWGEIKDMSVYNGNLYLLDNNKSDLYKYLSAESGFSTKKSYFSSADSADIVNPNSVAIDMSVYIGLNKRINKYTSGLRDGFSVSFPEDDVAITKVVTSKNLEKVYVWSKEKGAVYILSKEGTYEKQIDSEVFKKTNDIVVYENAIYALLASKIFKINLD